MARNKTRKTARDIQAGIEPWQAERFLLAVKTMETPLGLALREPGATFRRWSDSSPANIWVENQQGTILFHSVGSGFKCPVVPAFRTLRPFLDEVDSDMGSGGQAYVLCPEFLSRLEQHQIQAKTPAAMTTSTGPRF